jgi:ribosomal-protein-serine acetyltransferase
MLAIPTRSDVRQHPLQTERLWLQPIEPTDGPELWLAVDGSRATLEPWLPWVQATTTPSASAHMAEACVIDWDHGRALRFAIRERKTRAFIGVIGLESCVHQHRSCELGYWLRYDATGRGLMTEATRATLRFGFETVGIHRVRIAAATDNHASLGVIRRLGFRFEGIARQAEWCAGRWLDHASFGMLRTDPAPPSPHGVR